MAKQTSAESGASIAGQITQVVDSAHTSRVKETSGLAVRYQRVEDLIPYARNSRTHSDEQIAQIAGSIREFGFTNPVLVDGERGIIAGHGRVLAARKLGMVDVPTIELAHLTPAQRRAYVIADNKLAMNAGWDSAMLAIEVSELGSGGFDLSLLGFGDEELQALLGGEVQALAVPAGDSESIPGVQSIAVTVRGDVWALGSHRVMCGDSTTAESVKTLLQGMEVDLICTDPPYCSGGFQEIGKAAGSVGTSATHKMVANDTLSTRGYMALLKAAFQLLGAPYLYAFTDWRMWLYLFDLSESSGYGCKSMIVWDKGTPGMGRGWRAQHELVLWGCKQTAPYDKHFGGAGNVIQSKRTGNLLHTTEKPVDVIVALIENAPFAKTVADPFNGSGTTLIACETLDRVYFGMELDALYVDVTVKRWQAFTGKQATLDGDGRTFDEIAAERIKVAA